MGVLLVVLGGLALATSLTTLLRHRKAAVGSAPIVRVELVAGVVAVAGAAADAGRYRPLAWAIVIATVGAIALGLYGRARALREASRRRESTAALRLEQALRSRIERR